MQYHVLGLRRQLSMKPTSLYFQSSECDKTETFGEKGCENVEAPYPAPTHPRLTL